MVASRDSAPPSTHVRPSPAGLQGVGGIARVGVGTRGKRGTFEATEPVAEIRNSREPSTCLPVQLFSNSIPMRYRHQSREIPIAGVLPTHPSPVPLQYFGSLPRHLSPWRARGPPRGPRAHGSSRG